MNFQFFTNKIQYGNYEYFKNYVDIVIKYDNEENVIVKNLAIIMDAINKINEICCTHKNVLDEESEEYYDIFCLCNLIYDNIICLQYLQCYNLSQSGIKSIIKLLSKYNINLSPFKCFCKFCYLMMYDIIVECIKENGMMAYIPDSISFVIIDMLNPRPALRRH